MNATGLARYALMKSGIAINAPFVSQQEEIPLVAKAIKGSKFFANAKYADIMDLTNAIRRMRYMVSAEDEPKAMNEILPKGYFSDKNGAILNAYNGYMDLLEGMDSVGLIRMAIRECEAIDADFEVIAEIPLMPLEQELIKKLSGGNYKRITMAELYATEEKGVKTNSFKNCYGSANEVQDIITEIYSEKKLDECTLAVADTRTYSQIIYDIAVSKNLPVTFGCGIGITNTNPAKLLEVYNTWMTTGLFSATALDNILSSDAFDRKRFIGDYEESENVKIKKFFEILEQLKMTNDENSNLKKVDDYIGTLSPEQRNECVEAKLREFAKKLALPCEEFIAEFAKIRPFGEDYTQALLNQLDNTALSTIYNSLAIVRNAGIKQQAEEVIADILSSMVCFQRSEPGKLHVTDIGSAMSTMRKDMYIAGLSANNYPGTPKENNLLLDIDIKLFGAGTEELTSNGKIIAKKDKLVALAKLATALDCNLHFSYAGFNTSDLKNQNASSILFDLFRMEKGETASLDDFGSYVTRVEYFDPKVDSAGEIGKAYNEGKNITRAATASSSVIAKRSTDGRSYSPSELHDFFECKRKYMYKRVLGLPEVEEDNPFKVITAADKGILAHALMEELANSTITRSDFLELAKEAFESYIKSHPALLPSSVPAAMEEFWDMMALAYDTDPHRKVVLKEEDIECIHECGLDIHGFPDRVEQVGPNEYIIVDYKTGGKIKHTQDDIYSCLQVVIYAYLMEQRGYKIVGGEFRYLSLGQTVTCVYDENMKLALKDALVEFMEAVKHNEYPCVEVNDDYKNDNPCTFCSYAGLCERVVAEGDE